MYVFKSSVTGNLIYVSPELNNKNGSIWKEFKVAVNQIQLLPGPLDVFYPESKEGHSHSSKSYSSNYPFYSYNIDSSPLQINSYQPTNLLLTFPYFNIIS